MRHPRATLRPLLPALAAALFAVVRLPELTRTSLWFDELFSLGVAQLPLGEALRRAIADHTNPPLFYLLLKGWVAIGGDADSWLRLLPCLFALLMGAAMVWLVEEAAVGALTGTVAIILAAASPLGIDFANEVRGYSLLALLACCSLAAALRVRRDPSHGAWALLALINVALVHTHYFGWLTVAAEVIAATWWWDRAVARRVARAASAALLAFVPWGAAVTAHALSTPAPLRNVSWIGAPSWMAPAWLAEGLTGRSGNGRIDNVWIAVAAVAVVALVVGLRRRTVTLPAQRPIDREAVALFLIAAVGMPVLVWVASLAAARPFWVERYLLGASAPMALLIAIAMAAVPPRRWPIGAMVALAWAVSSYAAAPRRSPSKFDWRRFARRLDAAPSSPRVAYALEAFTGAPMERYAAPGMRVELVHELTALPAGESWLVLRRDTFGTQSPAEAATQRGLRVRAAITAEQGGQSMVALRVERAP